MRPETVWLLLFF